MTSHRLPQNLDPTVGDFTEKPLAPGQVHVRLLQNRKIFAFDFPVILLADTSDKRAGYRDGTILGDARQHLFLLRLVLKNRDFLLVKPCSLLSEERIACGHYDGLGIKLGDDGGDDQSHGHHGAIGYPRISHLLVLPRITHFSVLRKKVFFRNTYISEEKKAVVL
jgi:hypothetical protein